MDTVDFPHADAKSNPELRIHLTPGMVAKDPEHFDRWPETSAGTLLVDGVQLLPSGWVRAYFVMDDGQTRFDVLLPPGSVRAITDQASTDDAAAIARLEAGWAASADVASQPEDRV
jgi:hypothetical protein